MQALTFRGVAYEKLEKLKIPAPPQEEMEVTLKGADLIHRRRIGY